VRWRSRGQRVLARCGVAVLCTLLTLWALSSVFGFHWRFATWGGWLSGGVVSVESYRQPDPGLSLVPARDSRYQLSAVSRDLPPGGTRFRTHRLSLGLSLLSAGSELEVLSVPTRKPSDSRPMVVSYEFVWCSWVTIPLWLLTTVVSVPTLLLFWRNSRAYPPGHCPECGYSLTGNTSGICPECGMAIDTVPEG
jgi:hypothetical protein